MEAGGRHLPVSFKVNRRAKKYLIYVRRTAEISVTIPRYGSALGAAKFLAQQNQWIERAWRKIEAQGQARGRLEPGSKVWFRGSLAVIQTEPEGNRARVLAGDELCGLADPGQDFRTVVENRLKEIARNELPVRVTELAALHGSRVQTVAVRNQRTMWGSCSRRGAISLNWRLAHVPQAVRDYVIVHELMHLREMNHSARFWALVKGACPDFEQYRRWLKENGRALGM